MANTSNLQFGRQMSIAAFKAEHNVNAIDIVRNPNTNKLFFTSPDDSDLSGAVSEGWKADPVFSWVTAPATTDKPKQSFWMLHKKGSGSGQNVVDTL